MVSFHWFLIDATPLDLDSIALGPNGPTTLAPMHVVFLRSVEGPLWSNK